ncbi:MULTISPECIES: enolase C-terminal domain-like protein [Arthrobacter]|jgi:L-alanine-DL-glutamate epimerase-like enolase superfamily enzyme|uniref:enolase C-terminal domain-like protein n=1 Tax=Arthrobacter TaxID=1663 RepID=UPI00111707EA|nr:MULTISPECIES: enolase C-terminal domain-like protein [Arthrobacter]MDQ0212417.1 L-alanine-DL-glutamate epimerase-like enolase superfamily enzyme [Arthrobacter bambusae]MDQ0236865.1 L-alanine-DL-glutamate epimerase-like enolase superfamily enzyme [Arthrobacter bambusae]
MAVTDSTLTLKSLGVSAYTIPTSTPEADGTYTWDATTMVLVQATAGEWTGIGWTYAPAACAALISETLEPAVVGLNCFDVPAAAEAMARTVRNTSRPGMAGYAISAVDCALWDLKARILDLPLHRLFGAARTAVDVYGSGGFTTYSEGQLRTQLAGWAGDQEIPRVKIKIGQDRGTNTVRDLARIRQARETIGPGVQLFVDANGGYTAKQAVRVFEASAEQDLAWFEEPVSSDHLAGLRQVRQSVTADVAAGEYGTTLFYFQRMCEAAAVDCLQVDVSRCGGFTEWFRASAVAAAHGLEVSGHCAPNLTVPAAAGTPNFRHLEWFHDHVRIEELFFDGTGDPHGGSVRPREDRPGNGLTLRARDAEKYRINA